MGFDLDADGLGVIERDDAAVVFEDAEGPIDATGDEFVGCRSDGVFQQIVDGDDGAALSIGGDGVAGAVIPVDGGVAGGKREFDVGFEGFVNAVLAPGLGEGFQFDVRGIAALALVFGLDGGHLFGRHEEVGIATQFGELFGIQAANGDVAELEGVRRAAGETIGGPGGEMDLVDDFVGDGALSEEFGGVGGDTDNIEAETGGDGDGGGGVGSELGADEVGDGIADGLGGGVHDSGKRVDFDGGGAGARSAGAEGGLFGDGVGEEASGDTLEGGVGKVALDEIDAGGLGGRKVVAESGGLTGEGGGAGVYASGLNADLEAMDPPD